jgi:hypothetical protein
MAEVCFISGVFRQAYSELPQTKRSDLRWRIDVPLGFAMVEWWSLLAVGFIILLMDEY